MSSLNIDQLLQQLDDTSKKYQIQPDETIPPTLDDYNNNGPLYPQIDKCQPVEPSAPVMSSPVKVREKKSYYEEPEYYENFTISYNFLLASLIVYIVGIVYTIYSVFNLRLKRTDIDPNRVQVAIAMAVGITSVLYILIAAGLYYLVQREYIRASEGVIVSIIVSVVLIFIAGGISGHYLNIDHTWNPQPTNMTN